MTCNEFKRVVQNRPEDNQPAELLHAFAHKFKCPGCRDWSKARPDSEKRPITWEQINRILTAVESDPELLKEYERALAENHP
jgi:hypothetical protein